MKKCFLSILLALSVIGSMAQNASLSGRSIVGVLPKPNTTVKNDGVVVVSIWVDQYGCVQRAEAGTDGTTVVDSKVWAACRSAAMKAHFDTNADAPSLQKGTITYSFVTKGSSDKEESSQQSDVNKAVVYVSVKDIVEKYTSGSYYVKAKYYETYSSSDLFFSIEDNDYIIPVKLVKKDLGAEKRFAALNLSKGDNIVVKGRVSQIRVDDEYYYGLDDAIILADNDQPLNMDREPTFKGGGNEFAEWVNSQLVYPELAKENGIQGRVVLKFVIKADGSVSDVRVLRSVDPSLDKEAVRVVSKSPKWNPGYSEEKPVDSEYVFPVIFRLQ